jgi:hypothetical protein
MGSQLANGRCFHGESRLRHNSARIKGAFQCQGTRTLGSRTFGDFGNLAVLRAALISGQADLCPQRFWLWLRELCSMKPSLPYSLICLHRFK